MLKRKSYRVREEGLDVAPAATMAESPALAGNPRLRAAAPRLSRWIRASCRFSGGR
jgi:hypothetical protein